MAITAQIVADSINPKGCRLTTFVLEYPRFVHSELLTHRMFSKNAASSRAIPIEKMIQSVIDNPAMPVWWGKNQSGMQAKEELVNGEATMRLWGEVTDPSENDGEFSTRYQAYRGDLDYAQTLWMSARNSAVAYVKELAKLGLHKQIANRLLEPWFNIRIILSGTEFENFFALRAHPDAQPEIQALAYEMLAAYNASTPKGLAVGDWHVPFGDQIDDARFNELIGYAPSPDDNETTLRLLKTTRTQLSMKIAVARCARISYLNYEGKDDYAADIKLCDRLFGSVPRHLSPTEHVAQCQDNDTFIANYRGWKQYRYTFSDQNLNDPRVINKSLSS